MTRSAARNAAIVLSALALVACRQFSVRAKQDPGVDFSRLQTYAWLPLDQVDPADQRVLDRYIDGRIRAAVDRELGAKGYRPATGEPGFWLNYRLATDPSDAMRSGRRFYYGIGWGWPGAEAVLSESYDAGTLYIGALEAPDKRGIWIGAAQARLLPHISLEDRAKRVDDAVHAILESFPRR